MIDQRRNDLRGNLIRGVAEQIGGEAAVVVSANQDRDRGRAATDHRRRLPTRHRGAGGRRLGVLSETGGRIVDESQAGGFLQHLHQHLAAIAADGIDPDHLDAGVRVGPHAAAEDQGEDAEEGDRDDEC